MTDTTDILGRPPVMHPLPKPEPPALEDGWRGRRFISNVDPDTVQTLVNQGHRAERIRSRKEGGPV